MREGGRKEGESDGERGMRKEGVMERERGRKERVMEREEGGEGGREESYKLFNHY